MSCEKVAHVGSWKNGPFQIRFRKIASKQRRARSFIYNKYTRVKSPCDIWTKHLLNKSSLFKEFSAYKQLECIKGHEYKSEVSVLKETKWQLGFLLISWQ